jgi:hypothetical protein
MWQIEGLNLASPKLGTPTDIPNLKKSRLGNLCTLIFLNQDSISKSIKAFEG